MKIINLRNYQLRLHTEGKGIPALVIGSAIYYPRTFSANLKNHLQMHFIDHRGFALSGPPSHPEIDEIVDDIEQVRQELGLENFIIIGHSGHAFMALEYAKRYQKYVSHVVLIGAGPDYSPENSALAEQYFNESASPQRKEEFFKAVSTLENDIKSAPEKRFITFCLKFGARSWFNPLFDASELWKDVNVNMDVMDHVWGKVFRNIDITKNLENFERPVFLGLGLFDYLVPPFYTWNSARNKFKKLTVKIFDKSSHTPQFEEPEHFDSEILKWISENQ